MLKIREQPKIRFRSREGVCRASLRTYPLLRSSARCSLIPLRTYDGRVIMLINPRIFGETESVVSTGNGSLAALDELAKPILVLAQAGQGSPSDAVAETRPSPDAKHNSSPQDSHPSDEKLINSLKTTSTQALLDFLYTCTHDATPRLEHIVTHVETELRHRLSQDELMADSLNATCLQERAHTASTLLPADIATPRNTTVYSSAQTHETPPSVSRVDKQLSGRVSRNFCLYNIVKRCAEHGSNGLTEEALADSLAISADNTRNYLRRLVLMQLLEQTNDSGTKIYRIHASVDQEWIDRLVPTFERASPAQLKSGHLSPATRSASSEVLKALHAHAAKEPDWVTAQDLMRICSINFQQLARRCTVLMHQGFIEGRNAHEQHRQYRLSEKMRAWLKDSPTLLDL